MNSKTNETGGELTQQWGVDTTACPGGGEIDFWYDQNPTMPPPMPGRGVVGLNIDRCITA